MPSWGFDSSALVGWPAHSGTSLSDRQDSARQVWRRRRSSNSGCVAASHRARPAADRAYCRDRCCRPATLPHSRAGRLPGSKPGETRPVIGLIHPPSILQKPLAEQRPACQRGIESVPRQEQHDSHGEHGNAGVPRGEIGGQGRIERFPDAECNHKAQETEPDENHQQQPRKQQIECHENPRVG